MLESRDKKIPRRFREDLKMLRVSPRPTLNTSWISKASASQRRGRAGRTKSWHPSVAQGGTWEAHGWHMGGKRFMVFQCVSRTFMEFSMLEQLFTIVYMEVSFALCQLFQLPQCCVLWNPYKQLQSSTASCSGCDPQRFGRYEGVLFCSLSRVHQLFPTEPLLVPGAEMIRWPMIEVLGHAKFRCMISWIS